MYKGEESIEKDNENENLLEEYKKAYRNVVIREEKKIFKIHLVIYVFVNAVMASINLMYSPQVLWSVYPLIGWGIGLIAHYLTSVKWIEKRIKRREALAVLSYSLCKI